MVSKEYEDEVVAFLGTLNRCFDLSRKCAGIRSPTGAHYYASVLFTVLCTRSASFGMLVPGTSLAKKGFDHWDYGSLAVLSRSILEMRIAFYYLCIQECSEDEWACRLNLFHLHDCTARIHLFQERFPTSSDLDGFSSQSEELKDRLTSNAFFTALPPKQQQQLLRGKNAYLLPLENIAEAAGVETEQFRWLYRFLSSHVHGFPFSFYRVEEGGRGRGVHSKEEEHYCLFCTSFVRGLLDASCTEMQGLFDPLIND